jgi:xanthine dehydrogenase accessory factor
VKEVLDDIDRWRAAGKRVAIARVVGVEGSGPREPGATMAVSEDGDVAGSVSGGCVEGAVLERALGVLQGGSSGESGGSGGSGGSGESGESGGSGGSGESGGKPTVCTFGYSDDEAFAVGLTCGGTIHVYIEPLDW